MKKFRETVVCIVIGFFLLMVGFGGGYWYCTHKMAENAEAVEDTTPDVKLPGETEKRIITVDEVKEKLAEIGELSTYSGEYKVKKGDIHFRNFLDNINIPLTSNKIVLECEGIVKVGYDINDISPTIDDKSHIIYISLPEASVNDNYVIWDTVKCNEGNNPLNPIDFTQYQTLINEIEAEGLARAEEQGIYLAAEENVKNIIAKFLSGMDEYELKFI